MNTIYIASKANHRPHWRQYRDEGIPIISRWIDVDDKYSTDPANLDFEDLWRMCIHDARKADALVLYAEPGEVLKGALVEIGVALGNNKLVAVCGDKETLLLNGSWFHHPMIHDFTGHGIGYTLRAVTGM